MNSNKFKKGIFAPGIRGLKDMKGQNEKIVIKSKNINNKDIKGDKFFEELKKKRMMGNK